MSTDTFDSGYLPLVLYLGMLLGNEWRRAIQYLICVPRTETNYPSLRLHPQRAPSIRDPVCRTTFFSLERTALLTVYLVSCRPFRKHLLHFALCLEKDCENRMTFTLCRLTLCTRLYGSQPFKHGPLSLMRKKS